MSQLCNLIAVNRYRSVLSVAAVLIVAAKLVAFQPTSAPVVSALPVASATPSAAPSEVPTIQAILTDVATASPAAAVPTGMPAPLAQLVSASLASPTTLLANTPLPTRVPTLAPVSPTPVITSIASARPAPASSNSDAPITLIIPKIGVRAVIESVGVDQTGAMATPSGPYTVGWWDEGTRPGDNGNAVIDGHLDSAKVGAAVFWRLSALSPGDQILVLMPGNRALTFIVDHSSSYPFDQAPLNEIFGPTSIPSLNLITCSGVFDRTSRNYKQRLVVYSHLLKS